MAATQQSWVPRVPQYKVLASPAAAIYLLKNNHLPNKTIPPIQDDL